MKDIYSLEQIQKSKTPLEEMDDQTSNEVTEIESRNYLKAKDALSKIEKALSIQKNTTEELKLQGEKMKKIKEESINILRNAENASEVTHMIKQESSILPGIGTLIRGIKKWWKKDRRMKREVEVIKNRPERTVDIPAMDVEPFESLYEEQIEGENKTDEQLNKILNGIRKVRTEAMTQLEIVKNQEEDIGDIDKLGDFAKKIVDETEKAARK